MTENVWDEIWNKPAFNFLSYDPQELLLVPGKISVNEEWLKEVKAEGDRLKEKADKWDTEYQERDALEKLQKIKAIVTTYGPLPEDMISDIEDIVEESVERELRAEKRLRHKLEMNIEDIRNYFVALRSVPERTMMTCSKVVDIIEKILGVEE